MSVGEHIVVVVVLVVFELEGRAKSGCACWDVWTVG